MSVKTSSEAVGAPRRRTKFMLDGGGFPGEVDGQAESWRPGGREREFHESRTLKA